MSTKNIKDTLKEKIFLRHISVTHENLKDEKFVTEGELEEKLKTIFLKDINDFYEKNNAKGKLIEEGHPDDLLVDSFLALRIIALKENFFKNRKRLPVKEIMNLAIGFGEEFKEKFLDYQSKVKFLRIYGATEEKLKDKKFIFGENLRKVLEKFILIEIANALDDNYDHDCDRDEKKILENHLVTKILNFRILCIRMKFDRKEVISYWDLIKAITSPSSAYITWFLHERGEIN